MSGRGADNSQRSNVGREDLKECLYTCKTTKKRLEVESTMAGDYIRNSSQLIEFFKVMRACKLSKIVARS